MSGLGNWLSGGATRLTLQPKGREKAGPWLDTFLPAAQGPLPSWVIWTSLPGVSRRLGRSGSGHACRAMGTESVHRLRAGLQDLGGPEREVDFGNV
jgi:hypothetical protein